MKKQRRVNCNVTLKIQTNFKVKETQDTKVRFKKKIDIIFIFLKLKLINEFFYIGVRGKIIFLKVIF